MTMKNSHKSGNLQPESNELQNNSQFDIFQQLIIGRYI